LHYILQRILALTKQHGYNYTHLFNECEFKNPFNLLQVVTVGQQT